MRPDAGGCPVPRFTASPSTAHRLLGPVATSCCTMARCPDTTYLGTARVLHDLPFQCMASTTGVDRPRVLVVGPHAHMSVADSGLTASASPGIVALVQAWPL